MSIQRAVPIVRTTDPDATRAFYVDVLGFEVAMEHTGFLMLRSPEIASSQVIISWPVEHALDQQVHLADMSVDVGDPAVVDAAHAAAVANGWEIVHPLTDESWGMRRCFVREPSGTVVNVAAHLPVGTR